MNKPILVTTALIIGAVGILSAISSVRKWAHTMIPSLGIEGNDGSPLSTAEPSLTIRSQGTVSQAQASEIEAIPPDARLVNIEQEPDSYPDELVQLAQSTELVSPRNLGDKPRQSGTSLPRLAQTGAFPQVPDDGVAVPQASRTGTLIVEKATLLFVNDITVYAQADGVITNLLVGDGDVVKPMEKIYELEPRLAQAEIEVQAKELEQADLKAKDDSNLLYAQAAEKVALKDYEISNDLFARGAEDLLTNEKKSLEVKKAKLQIQVSTMEKRKDVAAVGVSTAKLNAAKVQLELRTFVAPWEGIVSEVQKHRYEFVRAGEPILRFTDMRKIRVNGIVELDGSIPPHLLLKSPAKISIQVAPGLFVDAQGTVGYVAPNASSENNYPFWVEIDNRIEDDQYLLRGKMSATVEITPRKR